MKIAIVCVRHPDVIGGTEMHIRDLARALKRRGNRVKILSLGLPLAIRSPLEYGPFLPPAFEPWVDNGVEIEPIPVSRLHRVALSPVGWRGVPKVRRFAWGPALLPTASWYALVLAPIISEMISEVDVVEGFCSDLLATATISACRQQDVPVVLTPLAHRGQWGADTTSARAYARADTVLAMLKPDRDLYSELGVESKRIVEVGVPVPQVHEGGAARLRAERDLNGPLVLFLGRRSAYKGYKVLLEAAPDIEATVAFVGPGPALPPSSSPNVLDVGPVSATERDAWLDAADILVLPSAGETFGAVIVEAWSVKTPVVTSDHPALRTLVEQAVGGRAVSATPQALTESITALLEDPQLRERLGRSGYEYWRQKYTVDAVAAQHEAVYRSIKSNPQPVAETQDS